MMQSGATTSDEEIAAIVKAAVAKALDRDPTTISLEHSLQSDLGAESLDFLDIAFALEKAFKIELPRVDIFRRAADQFGEDALVKDGLVTDFGRELLREGMPEIDPARFASGLRASDVPRMFTVGTFVRIVRRMIEAKLAFSRLCPKCGGGLVEADTGADLTCSSCGEVVAFPTGDSVLMADMMDMARSALNRRGGA